MFSFCISCQEVHVLIQAHGALATSVALRLQKDFSNFPLGLSSLASIEITISEDEPTPPRLPLAFKTAKYVAYGWGWVRHIFYPPSTQLLSEDKKLRKVHVSSKLQESLYEVSYLTLLSSLGEALEKRRFIRIHSLSLSHHAHGYVLHFSSGLGKSTLAALLTQDQKFKILSDEITLLKDNQLHSFPLRLAFTKRSAEHLELKWDENQIFKRQGLAPKLLYSIPVGSLIATAPFKGLLYGVKSDSHQPFIKEGISLSLAVQFLFDFSIGRHLPQIIELALRGKTVCFLPLMIMRRFIMALKLLAKNQVHTFYVADDPDKNKLVLVQYLQEKIGKAHEI